MGAEFDRYEALWKDHDPWAGIPERYNLGVGLTRGNVEAGRGERVCLNWENSNGATRQMTYGELDEESSRFASSLRAMGVETGDRVLLRLPNLPEFYVAAMGIAKAGGVFIPTSTQFRASEVEYRLRDSGAVAAVTTPALVDAVESSRKGAPTLLHTIVVGDESASGHTGHRFADLLERGDADFECVDTSSDDVAFIAYTSGTTGDPKGVVHRHRYPISYDGLIEHWHDYRDHDVCACPAELGWLLPVASTCMYAMRMGITITLFHPVDGRFDPPAWFRLIQKYAITNFVGTPTIYRMLTAHAGIDEADMTSLRHGVSAGEPLPPDTIEAVREKLGFTPLDGIGMSECMVYCHQFVGFDVAEGSCGWPTPGCEIRLMDDEMNEVKTGEEGVLCVRRDSHPGMMCEYLNKPEATAEVFRGDWYYSGDVLVKDNDGRFWFKGRNDDVIKASGYRISPFEVESCLAEHPGVLEAAVVASPDPVRGDVVKAFVVLREGVEDDESLAGELQAWVKSKLAPYKYPRSVEFLLELPKTPSGKIKRRLLRQREQERNTDG